MKKKLVTQKWVHLTRGYTLDSFHFVVFFFGKKTVLSESETQNKYLLLKYIITHKFLLFFRAESWLWWRFFDRGRGVKDALGANSGVFLFNHAGFQLCRSYDCKGLWVR